MPVTRRVRALANRMAARLELQIHSRMGGGGFKDVSAAKVPDGWSWATYSLEKARPAQL